MSVMYHGLDQKTKTYFMFGSDTKQIKISQDVFGRANATPVHWNPHMTHIDLTNFLKLVVLQFRVCISAE